MNVSTADGSIKFYDGSKLLKTVKVKKGKAVVQQEVRDGQAQAQGVVRAGEQPGLQAASTSGMKTLKVKK